MRTKVWLAIFITLALIIMPVSAWNGCCWFTGGGTIMDPTRITIGGNAMTMKDKPVRGQWEFVDHEGNVFHGEASSINCWFNEHAPGAEHPLVDFNYIHFRGAGEYDHQSGYTFDVIARDSGEPGVNDYLFMDIFDSEHNLVDHVEGYLSGNFQIHPSNNGHPCEPTD